MRKQQTPVSGIGSEPALYLGLQKSASAGPFPIEKCARRKDEISPEGYYRYLLP
jgi:hypothetical protein